LLYLQTVPQVHDGGGLANVGPEGRCLLAGKPEAALAW